MKIGNAASVKKTIHSIVRHPWLTRYTGSLRYAMYVIFHPFDGFWDLKNEKRGTMAAANTIVLMTLLSRLWTLQYSSFLFVNVNWEQVNIWVEMGTILLPLIIWVVSNWCLTTLFDGLGTMKEVYIATAYALTPYPLIQIPMAFLSNLITADEGALYSFFGSVSVLWCGGLLVAGVMQTHDYSLGKTVISILASLVGMLVIIVLCLLIFSMSSEAIAYTSSLIREIIIRFY